MKIAVLSPQYPPDAGGVSDHSFRLVQEWNKAHEVKVWKETAIGEIAAWRPDAIFVQFTPYLYAPDFYGIALSLPVELARLKLKLRKPVILLAHELHYPLGLTPDRLLIGTPQAAIFQSLALLSDRVIFTYELSYQRYVKFYPWRRNRFSWLPVGANIEPVLDLRATKQKAEIEAESNPSRKFLLQFGTAHPTRLFQHSFEALDQARRAFGVDQVVLNFVGLSHERVEKELRAAGRGDLLLSVRGLGYLPDTEVSDELKRADLILAPFLDGVSTRRGSVMAAMAHSRPILTTRAWSTRGEFPWESCTLLTDARDLNAFGKAAVDLLSDSRKAGELGREARRIFEKYCTWPRIASEILASFTA